MYSLFLTNYDTDYGQTMVRLWYRLSQDKRKTFARQMNKTMVQTFVRQMNKTMVGLW